MCPLPYWEILRKISTRASGRHPPVERPVLAPRGRRSGSNSPTTRPGRAGPSGFRVHDRVPIDDRRRALEALKESEDRYRRLVEFSPRRDGSFGGADPFRQPSLPGEPQGLDPEPSPGPTYPRFHPSRLPRTYPLPVTRILEKGEPNEWVEQKMVNLEGEILEVETKGTPIHFQGRPPS